MLKLLKKETEYLLKYKRDTLDEKEFLDIFKTYIIPISLIEELILHFDTIEKNRLYPYRVDRIWCYVGEYQYLPLDFCLKYKEKLRYGIYENKNISIKDTIKVLESFDADVHSYWHTLSERDDVDMEIAHKYKEKLNWFYLLKYNDYSEEFIREHIQYVNWESLCSFYELSEKFIDDFKNLVDWQFVTIHQHLSEKILRENAFRFNKREWMSISKYQKLSEQFILDFVDKLDLNLVTQCQYLSDDFIDENRNILKLVNLYLNPHISKAYLFKLKSEEKLQKKEDKLFDKISDFK